MKISENRIRDLIAPFKGSKGVTIPVLQAVQNEFGHIPPEAFQIIESEIGIPTSKSYGVATFYAQFRLAPIGKHIIKVCNGTACHVKGAETIVKALRDHLGLETLDTTEDKLFTIDEVACLGCCSLAPVMMIDDTTYGNLTIDKMKDVLERYGKEGGSSG
ncbi:MAG: NADH-quinone oxidoreductase subunit NuoE [Thermoplasmatota archaeon]